VGAAATRPSRALAWTAVGAVLALAVVAAPAWAATRLGGDVNLLYRRDSGTAAGVGFRRVTFDRRATGVLTGDLVGPRLGHYQLLGGLDFLSHEGVTRTRHDTRRRMDARVQLLPRAPVSLSSFYTLERADVSGGFLETSHADAWGANASARLLPGGSTQGGRERREDDGLGGQNSVTDRVTHVQSLILGPLSMHANYDFSNRRLEATGQGTAYRAERHTGRIDEQLAVGALGRLRSWVQLDRERNWALRGPLSSHGLDNRAVSTELETPLGRRATLRQAWTDERYRYESAGTPASLRFQIAEERLDARFDAGRRAELGLRVRGQYNHTERQPDLWLGSALGDLRSKRAEGWTGSARAGVNVFKGGLGDGLNAGEIVGFLIGYRRPGGSIELDAGRERTRSNGYSGQLQSDGLRGFSPRQTGTQRVHTVRLSTSLPIGVAAFRQDYEFQQVRNTTLGIDYDQHRVSGSFSYRVHERLWTDVSGDYQSTDQSGLYFGGLRQSASGTLSVGWRPAGSLVLLSRGSYGRIPRGSRESFWLLENSVTYRVAKLDLQLLQRNEKRATDPDLPDLGRDERLIELRATRQFSAYR